MDAKELFNQGVLCVEQNQWNDGIEHLNRFIELYPHHEKVASAYYYRGLAHRKKGARNPAINDFSQLIVMRPDCVKAYIGRALAYRNDGQYDKAIEDNQRALEIDSDCEAAIYGLAHARDLKKDEQKRKEFEEQIREEMEQKAREEKEKLAQTLEEMRKRLEGLEEKYRRATEEYQAKEEGLDKSLRGSLIWLVFFLGVFAATLMTSIGYGFIESSPFVLLPWIFLGGVVLSPLAWRIRYLRDEKLHNELLKLSYESKAHLEARWVFLKQEKQFAMEERLMEHWMEKGPEETILALMNKKDLDSSPLTPAALAAIIAAVRRGDK